MDVQWLWFLGFWSYKDDLDNLLSDCLVANAEVCRLVMGNCYRVAKSLNLQTTVHSVVNQFVYAVINLLVIVYTFFCRCELRGRP